MIYRRHYSGWFFLRPPADNEVEITYWFIFSTSPRFCLKASYTAAQALLCLSNFFFFLLFSAKIWVANKRETKIFPLWSWWMVSLETSVMIVITGMRKKCTCIDMAARGTDAPDAFTSLSLKLRLWDWNLHQAVMRRFLVMFTSWGKKIIVVKMITA